MLQLGYSEQREDYKLISVNNHPAKGSYASMKGAVTQGEFGSMMYSVFHPDSHARVTWDHWTRLHGRAVEVYGYAISRLNSSYELAFGDGPQRESTIAGAEGEIYVDPETKVVEKLTRRATEVSPNFPITAASTVLTYEYADVGGRVTCFRRTRWRAWRPSMCACATRWILRDTASSLGKRPSASAIPRSRQ